MKFIFEEKYVNALIITTIEAIGDNKVFIPIIMPNIVVNDVISVQPLVQLEAPPIKVEKLH